MLTMEGAPCGRIPGPDGCRAERTMVLCPTRWRSAQPSRFTFLTHPLTAGPVVFSFPPDEQCLTLSAPHPVAWVLLERGQLLPIVPESVRCKLQECKVSA